jgi:hypothetical protein
MKIRQFLYIREKGWQSRQHNDTPFTPQILLVFGERHLCQESLLKQWLNEHFPDVPVMGCSTAGEIIGTEVHDDAMVVTAIEFESARTVLQSIEFESASDSKEVGTALANQFDQTGLRWIFVLSDGLNINGSQLIEGMNRVLPSNVIITGGLAGDGNQFENTTVCINQQQDDHKVVALGLYGDHLQIGYGSKGGWDPFGPDREVTHSKDNVLYKLDNQSALSLYKTYLGEYAKDLPASGLLFPLKIIGPSGQSQVRTLLAINDEEDSMTFAGDIPEGHYARLMKANFDRLIMGASNAAEQAQTTSGVESAELAILISCVGRKMVLEQRIEEEVESVQEILGTQPVLTGFYSYGEICPQMNHEQSTFHNQTMTITVLSEPAITSPEQK